jgi:class 3 adenylate cyclase
MPEAPTGTVTLLFTDIEDSTRMWEKSPEARQEALARHDKILRDAINAYDGYVFKTVRCLLRRFAHPSEALEAAPWSQCTLGSEEWGEQIRLCGPAEALHEVTGYPQDPVRCAEVERYLAVARASSVARRLGGGAGGETDHDDRGVMAYALEEVSRA